MQNQQNQITVEERICRRKKANRGKEESKTGCPESLGRVELFSVSVGCYEVMLGDFCVLAGGKSLIKLVKRN